MSVILVGSEGFIFGMQSVLKVKCFGMSDSWKFVMNVL